MPTLSEQVSAAINVLENASSKAESIVETDATIETEAGERDSLPMILRKAKEALSDLGPFLIGSFEIGGITVSNPTQVVRLLETNDDYRWDGLYPKNIEAGTVETNGGEGIGRWVNVGSLTLKQKLIAPGGMKFISGLPFVCAESYSGSTDTEIIQAAINDAIFKKIKIITFNRDYVVSNLTNRQEVIFLGTHTISGDGAYRLRVVDGTEDNAINAFGINALTQLTKFASKSSPVVVFVGDSLTTYDPNSIDTQHSLFASMCRKIKADNPSKTITFYNRGIGGSVWYEIDGVAVAGWPDWYTNHALPWLDYVSSLNPDLVILSAGMNDSGTININNVKSAITKVKAFPSSPDVLCMTTPVPSTAPGGSFDALFATKAAQEGRDYAAGVVRSTSASLGVPVIDINRQCNAIRDGFDILESYGKLLGSPTLSSGGFKSTIECRNWSATVAIADAFPYTAPNPLAVKVGPSPTDVVLIKADISGNIKLDLYNRDENIYQTVVLTGQAIPNTLHNLSIEVYNNSIRVFINGTAVDSLPAMTKLRVGGGLYLPSIGNFEDNFNSGHLSGISKFSYGVHKKLIPLLTNNELWGVGNGDAFTKSPLGGNGINHPTSIGAIALYQEVFNHSDFSLNPSSVFIGQHADGGYKAVGGVVTRIWGRWGASSIAAKFDTHISWPVAIPPGTYRFIASGGVNAEDLDATTNQRDAQTLICPGRPNQEGIDVTVFCLTQTGFGRYFDWELIIS